MSVKIGGTIREATQEWVDTFNVYPRSMIVTLRNADPDSWHEITVPSRGDPVYVYDECATGTVLGPGKTDGAFLVHLEDGREIEAQDGEFELEYDSFPMWKNVWAFGEQMDDDWLSGPGALQAMSRCGFRIFEHDEWGYFFALDGGGYDFIEAHFVPLYKARGLKWHKEEA